MKAEAGKKMKKIWPNFCEKWKNECSVQCAALKIQKPKRTQKGMQNQSMMPSGLPTCLPAWHCVPSWADRLLQRHKLQGSWPQCGRNRGNAHAPLPLYRASPPITSQVPTVRRSPLNVSKDETPQGHGGCGAEAVQAHKTNGVNLQCRLSRSRSLSLSTLSLQECSRCLCVCV